MYITRIQVSNYRCLREADVSLNPGLNIIVGKNESEKSTLLEAVYLALTGQLNARPILTELHPHLFNAHTVSDYIGALRKGQHPSPPFIQIELYFHDDPALTKLKGSNNSRKENLPGVVLRIEMDPEFSTEYAAYFANPHEVQTLPVEYYIPRWRGFTDNTVTSARSIPLKPCLIDASTIRNNASASKYVVDIMKDTLSQRHKVDLALSFRQMKDKFLDVEKVKAVNEELAHKKGVISDKTLTLSMDTSSRNGWEAGIVPHLDDVPINLVGKGEQNSVKIKLALETSAESHIVLIEEPENHLSFPNLNALIGDVATRCEGRQLMITTHSSFVLNKLGVGAVLLFHLGQNMTLRDLPDETREYFMKLPGHDTLRMILANRVILVEGPSDELIVQAAFRKQHQKMPLEGFVDVISVRSLAFKRFLDIARILKNMVDVVTDNDGDSVAIAAKYAEYSNLPFIRIRYDSDESCPTLEPQLLKANGKAVVERILDKPFSTEQEALDYMKRNKTDVALKFFNTNEPWTAPQYILDAIA